MNLPEHLYWPCLSVANDYKRAEFPMERSGAHHFCSQSPLPRRDDCAVEGTRTGGFDFAIPD